MDTNSMATLATIVLFIILLYIVLTILKRKKEAKFLHELESLAEVHDCQISEFERWNRSIIGIDRDNRHLFVIQKGHNKELSMEVNLATIQKCRLLESSRMVNLKESSNKVVDKIELVLSDYDRTREDILVEFYNTAYDSLLLANELRVAEKWNTMINQSLK